MSDKLNMKQEALREPVDEIFEELGLVVLYHVSTQGEEPRMEPFNRPQSTYPNYPA